MASRAAFQCSHAGIDAMETNPMFGAGGAPAFSPFTMAFQPIVDVVRHEVFAHEALVRSPGSPCVAALFRGLHPARRYAFDQACRGKAIALAGSLGMASRLSLNMLPNALARPEDYASQTVLAAERSNFPIDRLMFEVTEGEQIANVPHLTDVLRAYKPRGLTSAIDDFGAGFAGIELLAMFQPDVVKIDMHLVRDIHTDRVRRTIVRGLVGICSELGIRVVAEGVETRDELQVLRGFGVELFQGYLFARPQVEALPVIDWHAARA
jgi:EAL domain-containing protein (putative c-di-GMP-specific phosphodiesterase class I)